MTYRNTDQLTDTERRERWCGTQTKRAEDLTAYDVIKWNGQWTKVFQVYRYMNEWDAEFGSIGGDTSPGTAEYRQADEALNWAAPTWVLLRLFDLANANPAESPDFTVRVYKFELIEVQTLPAFASASTTPSIPNEQETRS